VKVSEIRYTYVCQRKQHYDEIIGNIEGDNKKLAEAVEKARRMIVAIYDCDKNEQKIDRTLKDLVSALITIDEKNPNYDDMKGSERHHKKRSIPVDEETGMVKQEIHFSASEHKEGNWKAEEMKETYLNKENKLCKRELEDGKIKDTEIMDLKIHLQKVMVVPTGRTSRVFLMGGAKDSDGKQAINNCYEVNVKNVERESRYENFINHIFNLETLPQEN
jgi:hypothetical protein